MKNVHQQPPWTQILELYITPHLLWVQRSQLESRRAAESSGTSVEQAPCSVAHVLRLRWHLLWAAEGPDHLGEEAGFLGSVLLSWVSSPLNHSGADA